MKTTQIKATLGQAYKTFSLKKKKSRGAPSTTERQLEKPVSAEDRSIVGAVKTNTCTTLKPLSGKVK